MKLKKKLIIILSIVTTLLILTIFNAFTINGHNLKVREETLTSDKLSKNNTLLICYFADLNYGTNLSENEIIKLGETINNFNPDIIIFGGDLIHNTNIDDSSVLTFLSNLDAKYGKFAVYGEEDLNNENTKNLLNQSGFTILNNDNQRIYCNNFFINLVGIEPTSFGNPDIDKAFDGVNPDYYTLVISHCPDIFKDLNDTKSDYVLSAHSLGGPVYVPLFDLLYRPNGALSYFRGKYTNNDLTLDISSGLGTKNEDVRLFSDEEIVMYKLKASE